MNERRFELPNGSMAALEIGNEKTTACSVVFLHGWMDNAGSFKNLINAIHQCNPDLHLLAIDLLVMAYPVINPRTITIPSTTTLLIYTNYWMNYRQTDWC